MALVVSSKAQKKRQQPCLPLDKCRAKTYCDNKGKKKLGMTVLEHCRITGHVCKELLKKISLGKLGLVSSYLDQLPLVTALHDVGKVSPGFQHKIHKAIGRIPAALKGHLLNEDHYHATVSEASLKRHYPTNSGIPEIAGAHHGNRERHPLRDTCDPYGGTSWAQRRKELVAELEREFGELSGKTSVDEEHIWECLAGLVTISDWMGSDETWFEAAGGNDIPAQATRAIEEAGWQKLQIKPNLSFGDIFKTPTGKAMKPYKAQTLFYESVNGPGVYIFEEETGRGKTEAALHAAYKMLSWGKADGIYFGLPTRTTSDRIYERIIPFLKNICIKGTMPHLIHGTSWLRGMPDLRGSAELAPGGRWFLPNRRAMLSAFGVGTIDQALLSTLAARHNYLRSFGLARKVVILDEVHSYDMYTSTLMEELTEKLIKLDCVVIILSATLNHEQRARIVHDDTLPKSRRYPLITTSIEAVQKVISCPPAQSRRVKVHYTGKKTTQASTEKRLIRQAAKRAAAGQHVLWIVNHVQRAVELYDEIEDYIRTHQIQNVPLGILHSRYPAWQRNVIEDEWIGRLGKVNPHRRKSGSILVSTQVMEQSVDIDADVLFTDLAPADFIIQRAGRLHRHARKNRPCKVPEVYIQVPPVAYRIKSAKHFRKTFGINAKIYNSYVLWRTHQTLSRMPTLNLPNDVRRILSRVYKGVTKRDPRWVHELHQAFLLKKDSLKYRAIANTGSHISPRDDMENEPEQYTRIESIPTRQLLLLSNFSETNDDVTLSFPSGYSCTTPKVTDPSQERDNKTAREISQNLVKVPESGVLNDVLKNLGNSVTPIWLERLAFGYPLPVVIQGRDLVTLGGVSTGYVYCPVRGVYRTI